MVKITEYLQHGEENAQSGRDMARLLGVNLRDISIALLRSKENARQAAPFVRAQTRYAGVITWQIIGKKWNTIVPDWRGASERLTGR